MKQYNARVRSEFEQALGYNIVIAKSVDENTSNRYAIVTTEPFDLSAKLSVYDMRLTSNAPNLGEVKRAVLELKRLQSEGLPRVDTKDISEVLMKIWPKKIWSAPAAHRAGT